MIRLRGSTRRARHASVTFASPVGPDVYGRPIISVERRDDSKGASAWASESVVKVYCVSCGRRPTMPWNKQPERQGTGSGFYILHEGSRLLLTNAHVVADAAFIEVRKAGDARKYVATRSKIAHECDLAALIVEDDEFWKGMEPLSFGSMPRMQDEVTAVGYPAGGEGISITQGVVSRIEIQQYAHSGKHLLAIQIDAAINPGNSGGPALNEAGNVIGVSFQNQEKSQNIGYVIPVSTIIHFLEDTDPEDSSRCSGFCSVGIRWQALENEQLRDFVGMAKGQTGVLVCGIGPLVPAASQLRRNDVILEMDGQIIANDGSFAVGPKERLSFLHLIHLKFPKESVVLKILRGGNEMTMVVSVAPVPQLVPSFVYDAPQPYFIYGGAVFVPLTRPYLQEWGENWMGDTPHELMQLMLDGMQTVPDEQPVVLSHCFPSRKTAGYSSFIDQRVVAVNGEPVVSLRQMYTVVKSLHASEKYLHFDLLSRGGNQIIAIETCSADEVTAAIMDTYAIPLAVSPDLQADQEL